MRPRRRPPSILGNSDTASMPLGEQEREREENMQRHADRRHTWTVASGTRNRTHASISVSLATDVRHRITTLVGQRSEATSYIARHTIDTSPLMRRSMMSRVESSRDWVNRFELRITALIHHSPSRRTTHTTAISQVDSHDDMQARSTLIRGYD